MGWFLAQRQYCDATDFLDCARYTDGKGGRSMTVYLDLVLVLNFLVDFLLLLGTNRLCGYPMRPARAAGGALLGGVYAGACALPGFFFLGNVLWRLIFLALMSVIAFGFDRSCLRRGILFVFLCMALGGIATGMGSADFPEIAAAAGLLLLMCFVGFRGCTGRIYTSVTLVHGGKKRQITALRDTGNALKDPISGESVLVVGSDVASDLLGLSTDVLKDPITAMENAGISGLRLIPYRSVGNPYGMLLAVRLDEVWIGKEKTGGLVAFAPEQLGRGEAYQALAGGVL